MSRRTFRKTVTSDEPVHCAFWLACFIWLFEICHEYQLYIIALLTTLNAATTPGLLVNLIAPETIFLSQDTSFGKNVTVEPYVVFGPKVKVGDNSHIKSFTHIEGTKIEKNVTIGPYARLRPGTILKKNTKIRILCKIRVKP